MKKILLIVVLLQIASLVNAQTSKIFLNNDGKVTEAWMATSYIIVKQVADTAWTMEQFDMGNVILQSGTFKDRNLQIPHGKYVYYRRSEIYNNKMMNEWQRSDTANWITTEGEFKDGKKEGRWTDYLLRGKKREEAYYKNGVLNGPYRSYNDDHRTVALSGNYVNGQREGDWDMIGLNGQVIERDKYREGTVRNRKILTSNYNSPKPPKGFETFINRAFRKAVTQQNVTEMFIDFTVKTDGKVVNPHVLTPWRNDDPLVRTLFDIIERSPPWKPANSGDDSKPLEDFAMITVEIKDGEVTAKVLDNAEARTLFHNLNTDD